jgi:hypothetical protein
MFYQHTKISALLNFIFLSMNDTDRYAAELCTLSEILGVQRAENVG